MTNVRTRLPRRATCLALLLAASALSFDRVRHDPRPQRGAGGDDFVTGGGWIDGPMERLRVSFGFNAGFRGTSSVLRGHLNFIDASARLHLRTTSLTAYATIDETTRSFEGTAVVGGEEVTFVATVSDAGEPGRDDTFALSLSNGYSTSGSLRGGNVQLHR